MNPIDQRIRREQEGFAATEDVELYTVDATEFGGARYYFTPAPVLNDDGDKIAPVSDGNVYTVVPITTDGFEWGSDGELPSPVVRFHIAMEKPEYQPHVAAFLDLLESLDDLLGAKVYRVLTKRRFLDDGSDPDPNAHKGVEVFNVEQKQSQTDEMVEFVLSSGLDVEGEMLPRGQILARCRHRYRVLGSDGEFVMRSCPYAGAACFDIFDQPVDNPSEDRCRRELSSCKARYGENTTLPFAGFPGASRVGLT